MILDWTIDAPVVAESPIWPNPGWTGDGPGPVRWIVLRGHAYVPVQTTHVFMGDLAVDHSFTISAYVTGHQYVSIVPASQILKPTAASHSVGIPTVTGHQFLPVE